ncbi:hypothetical protein [Actinomadura sp. B10D3]|uniref:hypothetical protein n=1 Tax=Actinomadura sp. B10D3 TaxID=3153557 RepID=UPI00325F95C1
MLNDFTELLQRGSAELYADNPDFMSTGQLNPTDNALDAGDLALFFAGLERGLITLHPRGARPCECSADLVFSLRLRTARSCRLRWSGRRRR